MKSKRILTLTACVLLILCLVCTGCTPEEPTIPDDGGSGGGGGGEVTPVFEANNFSDDVYALANRRGDEGVFEDYYRGKVPFNQLVDRQIGVIATEIVERLNDVYGSDNYKYSFDNEVPDYTTWQVGEARGAKYAVHLLGDVFFVFVLDEQGNYIEDEQGFPLESDGKTYEAVYFASEQDNNRKSTSEILPVRRLPAICSTANTATPISTTKADWQSTNRSCRCLQAQSTATTSTFSRKTKLCCNKVSGTWHGVGQVTLPTARQWTDLNTTLQK